MDTPTPEEERRLELYAALVEAIAAMHKPTESDVRRVLRTLHTGNPEFDREMSEYAETLHLLALNKPDFLKALHKPDFPYDFPPDPGPISFN